jgi:hypothetical protein
VDFPEPTSPAHPRGLEVLPRLTGERDVGAAADLIASYPGLSEKNGIALMQAARQYQLGVWVANEDPNLAWLRLVGAVEVAAGTLKVPKQSYVDQARELHPDFAGELDGLDPDVAERIAKSVSNVIGATRKFLYFLEKFCPAAPGERPDDHDQVDWNALGPMFKQIYGYRSDALHNGRPFPAPMCEVPRTDVNEVPIERAWGLSSAADNASWTKEEYPMLLATFEFIVRGALINWWEQLPAS